MPSINSSIWFAKHVRLVVWLAGRLVCRFVDANIWHTLTQRIQAHTHIDIEIGSCFDHCFVLIINWIINSFGFSQFTKSNCTTFIDERHSRKLILICTETWCFFHSYSMASSQLRWNLVEMYFFVVVVSFSAAAGAVVVVVIVFVSVSFVVVGRSRSWLIIINR